ncbi:ABC transporter substrate-binding protein [Zafaria cholistanensis]|uniref:ABC transporter substrate-binding protein n=2 Tax=Zafaria cholistanensis TaxID=1682741 RepID=A0A5A7NQ69_9MICC|nr:ABC transporter substrate-binding protein [Zafaria cholistanensis]
MLAAGLLTGCGISIPADPEGTLERVRDGHLRVGVSTNAPWAETRDGAEPAGIEPDLVRKFAATLPARIQWSEGGEQKLVDELKRGNLDIVLGGLTKDTPWAEKVAVTAPYAEATDEHGETHKHVMATPPGENAFLLELEKFLARQEVVQP